METYSFLKTYCRCIYFVGSGNFWHEESVIKKDNTILYRLFQFALFGMLISMTILEIMAAFFGDFPNDEHGDCISFSVSHTIVLTKIFSVIWKKEVIKDLNRKMVKICEGYEEKTLMVKKFKTIKTNFTAYFIIVYGSASMFIIEGLIKLFRGSHFVTIVTYYPPFEDDSPLATAVRVLMTLNLTIMLMTMVVSADLFAVTHLITFKYKIITLNNYFKDIRTRFDRDSKIDLRMASDNLNKELMKGISIHGDMLRVCKQLDKSFGSVLALQLVLSTGTAVSLMLQLVLNKDLTLVASIKIILFVFALYFLLALFVCNAGEITYQASLLSDTIFHCGWHLCDSNRRVRSLICLSVMQAQRPLVMKAFKMIEMTYATFLMAVRTTYSVFALIYAQNQ